MNDRTRFCSHCGDMVTDVGFHNRDGRFDQYSVWVAEEEIAAAMQRNHDRARVSRVTTRWNIAFGKHIGTYIDQCTRNARSSIIEGQTEYKSAEALLATALGVAQTG